MGGLDHFCGDSQLWDLNLLLNSSYPKFTQCFQDTVLIWFPCGALWAAFPVYLWYMSQQKYLRKLPLNGLNIAKTIVASLTLAVCIIQLLRILLSDEDYTTVKPVSSAVQIATFILFLIVIQLERHYGFITSGVLFIVLLLMVVAGVVPFYTQIIEKEYEKNMVPFALFCIYFCLILLELCLYCKAETVSSRQGYQQISNHQSKPDCPESKSSFPCQVFFMWIIGLLKQGYRSALSESQVFALNPRDQHKHVIPPFERCWQAEVKKCAELNKNRQKNAYSSLYKNKEREEVYHERTPLVETKKKNTKYPSLTKVILKVFGGSILISQFLKLLSDLLTFVTPLLINELISYTQNRKSQQEWKGFVLAFSFFLVAMLKTCIYQYHFHVSMTLGMRIKSAVIAAVYKKALTISGEAKKENTVGEIVNLMSVDCQRIQDATGFIYMVWSMPLMIVISMYMLYGVLGPSCFAGLAVLLLLLPINVWCAHKQRSFQMYLMKTKDERLKIMNEVLNGMKVLKLYAWEESFQEKISTIRQIELTTLKKTAYLVAATLFIFTCAPYVVQLVSFAVYIAVSSSGYLDPSTAFVSISLFGILRMPMSALPMVIPFMIQANVSISRVSKFLRSEDLDPNVVRKDPNSDAAVKIEGGTFTWDKGIAIPTLRNINIRVQPGSLVAVVGHVGSGKSSLLSAMLGEMTKLNGTVTLRDKVAYVPQEAWIQNATVKDNIVFGNNYTSNHYRRVVEACSLESDFDILPAKDETEIGEKGINLSGGQKQRVSLARAVYSNADTYLFDDPLSAVDSHVGKHIFNEVIGRSGLLKKKTRILVTHGIHWLPMVDHIFVIENGFISEEGSYEDLLSHEGHFANFLKEFFVKELKESETEDSILSEEDPDIQEAKRKVLERLESVTSEEEDIGNKEAMSSLKRQLSRQLSVPKDEFKKMDNKAGKKEIIGKKLIEEEKQETGNVKFSIYLTYIKAVGAVTFFILTVVYIFFQTTVTFSSIWLSLWTDDELLANSSAAGSDKFVNRNNMYLAVYGISGVVQGAFILLFAIIATTQMVQAAGSLHFDVLHNVLRSPMAFFDTTPIGRIINRFSRDVETVDNNLPSTIRSFYGCIFNVLGTFIIISYSTPIFIAIILPIGILYWLIQRFYIPTSRQLKRIESTTRSPIYVHFAETVSGAASIRAYDVDKRFIEESKQRVDHNLSFYFANLVSNRFLGWGLELIGNLVILAAAMFAVTSENLEAGLVGLSVSYASQVTGALNYLVRNFSDLETNIVSVERLQEYTKTPTESDWIIAHNRPSTAWPTEGKVDFVNYQTRYRAGLDLVLKGVNCNIQAGEKVGIVGRTGAGKSSLTVALFRLIEPASGSIFIDGISVADIGLHDLRKKLTILPQDPVIFSGTLRMNLDPFNEHDDSTLWSALEHANLKAFVSSLPDLLNYECGEGGQNLSVGQRQLLCLARTLIRKTKILILDEATAAVDMETDDLIQSTIRTQFSDCTILTIAHRLNTIMDYDKIMVLDQGRVKEFDSPSNLLAQQQSIFYGLAKDAGIV